MVKSATDNKAENKNSISKKLDDSATNINFFILNHPTVTLAVGLIMGAIGVLYPIRLKKTANTGKPHELKKFTALNYSALAFVAYVAGITGLQLHSIKKLYSHAVGIELGKKPEEVTRRDVLFHTKNTVVQKSRKDFLLKIAGRVSALLVPFVPYFLHRKAPPHPSLISGSTAIETAIEDQRQTVVDELIALSYKEQNKTIHSTAADTIENILVMNRRAVHNKSKTPYSLPPLGTQERKNEETLAGFIADLLDKDRERYRNPQQSKAASSGYFNIGTFVYLMGNEAQGTGKSFLDQEFPVNLAYVELARKDVEGLPHVKEAADAIAKHENPDSVFKKYGIDMNKLARDEGEKMRMETGYDDKVVPVENEKPLNADMSQRPTHVQKIQIRDAMPEAHHIPG